MDKITGQINWTPVNKLEPIEVPTLNILLGVNSKLQEILLTSIIASTHHKVHVVDSCEMILKSLDLDSFHLCLLSHNMPGELTAIETTCHIRTSQAIWSQIPIIGLIDQKASLIIAECICSGMNSFICAPINSHKISSFLNYYQNKVSTKS